jgi:hypothetical protein
MADDMDDESVTNHLSSINADINMRDKNHFLAPTAPRVSHNKLHTNLSP